MSAAILEAPQTTRPKRRRKVKHLFWQTELEWASRRRGGAVLVTLCGREERCPEGCTLTTVEVVGRLMAIAETRDCRTCVRSYEAHLRRLADDRDRLRRLNSSHS